MRLFVALQATVVGVVGWVIGLVNPTMKFGTVLFWGLAAVALVHCLLAGRRSTADCLSQEKRDGTMGLLFLTDLTGFDVVIGKLVATSLGGFYGLLAIFPVMAVPLLVGGMTSGELWRMTLVLVVTFVFSLSIGVFCSAGSREYKEAIGRNFAVLTTLTVLLPVLGVFVFVWRNAFIQGFFLACPFYTFRLCEDTAYGSNASFYWSSLAVMHGLSWLFVMRACRLLPISWQDEPSAARARFAWWRTFKRAITYGKATERAAFRKWALDQNAYFWLAARERLKPAHVWAFLAAACGWWLVGWALNDRYWLGEISDVTMALLLTTTLKLWVTVEAGQRLAQDREIGAMELLLCTALTVEDFLRGQYLALRREFLKPLIAVFLALFGLMALALANNAEYRWLPWAAGIVMFPADILCLALVGIWMALLCKTHTRATLATVMRVLVLPWLGYGAVMLIIGALRELNYMRDEDTPVAARIAIWFFFGIGADVFYGWRAWNHLRTDFREMAMQRYGLRAKRMAEAKKARGPVERWRPALAGAAMVIAVGCVAWTRARPQFPPPVMVTMMASNAPLQAFPTGRYGMFLILPDGSLWRWGEPAEGPLFPRAPAPEQIGTNHDWVKVQVMRGMRVMGLRRNGTIWEWGLMPNGENTQEPVQRNPDRDWKDIAAANALRVALRQDGTLWAWERRTNGYVGVRGRFLRQVGTNANWERVVAVDWQTIEGVQSNGTVWAMKIGPSQHFQGPTQTNEAPGDVSDNWVGRNQPGWPKLTLTTDGTLWTEGIDYSGEEDPSFWERIKGVQNRMTGRPIGSGPRIATSAKPRPLMKLRYQ
jgi:hypothetical protein